MARFGNGPYNAPPGTLGSVNERTRGGMTVSGRAFAGDLPSASSEPLRILQRITPGYDSRSMSRMGASEEAIVMDRNFGIGTGAMSPVLEGHVVPPSEADGWDDAPPTSLSNISDPTNVAVPVVRRCRAPNLYDLPGEGEILFLHKPFHGSRRISTKRGAGKRFNLVNAPGVAAQRGMPAGGPLNPAGPLVGFNARSLEGNGGTMSDDYYAADAYAYRGASDRSLNRILFEKQWQLFQDNPQRYSELTPLQIWYGCELDWTGWSCDGPVRLEEAVMGPSTRISDSYGPSKQLGPFTKGIAQGRDGEKMYSVVRSGKAAMQDFFESRGITRGGRLGYVLTKVKLPPSGNLPFLFTTKSGTLEQGIPGVAWTGQAGKMSQDPKNLMKHKNALMKSYFEHMTTGFRPFLLCPLANPDGGYFDPSFHCYDDEFGIRHYDALVMTVARTLFEPFVCNPQCPFDSPADPGFGPVTDGSQAMRRMGFPGVLVYPLKDGYSGLL